MNASTWRFLITSLLVLLSLAWYAGPAHCSVVVVYLDESGAPCGYLHPEAHDAMSALSALASPPSPEQAGRVLTSAVPPGTRILDLWIDGDTTVVDFSIDVIGGAELAEERLLAIFQQVEKTLYQFGMADNVRMLAEGKLLSDYTRPIAPVQPGPEALQREPLGSSGTAMGISGRKITVSPGHGIYWNGSYWPTQRPVYCSPLNQEDFHNLENAQYLEIYLQNDGATVKMVRCTNKSYGNHYTGNPWWKMGACYWLQHVGYPCSVYGPYGCNLGSGGSDSGNDIISRPLSSDYDGSDIYVSLHTNGYTGDCYPPNYCPTGSDIYYDCGTEHAPWCTVSQNLATSVNNAMIDAIRNKMPDSDWANRGLHNSNGAYGEIRVPDRAAILIELGFHDTCAHDALHLQDNFFRSTAMWGIYKGICSYFGTTPTWDYYSDEHVSHDIPSTMNAGEVKTVHVTFRNKGVLWSEARQFRLGAVGDSDPFTSQTRHYISGEVGPNGTYTFTFSLTAPTTPGTYLTDWRMVREAVTWFGATCQQNIEVVAVGPDYEPPSVPTNVVAGGLSTSEIGISWTASTDNVGVAGYKVFRDGSYLTSVTATSCSDSGLPHNTTHTYTVSAYDAAANESAQSSPATGTTWYLVYEDGFPNIDAWTADMVADGTYRGVSYDPGQNHGTYSGAGSAVTAVGSAGTNGCFSYRGFAEPFTSGRYEGWFYDSASSNSSRQGLHIRGYNGAALAFSIYMGTFSSSPGSFGTYSAGVFNGAAWNWNGQIQPRSIGWHNFKVDVMPYLPSGIKFYIDGSLKASQNRFPNLDSRGISRTHIGHNYNVNYEGWFDDMRFSVPVPSAPTMGVPTVLGTSGIRWNFTDVSDCESEFALHDDSHVVKGTAGKNSSYLDETGLAANTQHTRHVHARNGIVDSPASASASRYTLSVAPTTLTVTCDRATSTWYGDPVFSFTAEGGFGAGKVQYYTYVWNQSATYTWTGAEPQWDSGMLLVAAAASGSWYLHVKGYNGDDVENGTLTLGPYQYTEAVDRIAQAKGLADASPVSLADKVVTANFGSYLYIEEDDRSSAVRVAAGGPAAGTLASVAGVMGTQTGERVITDANVIAGASGTIPAPILFRNAHAGGGSLNPFTPGVTGGVAVHNIGLLMTAVGMITHVDSGFIYIDDGSALQDGSGYTGIRVDTSMLTPGKIAELSVDKYAIVTGICTTQDVGGNIAPVVKARGDSDVVLYP